MTLAAIGHAMGGISRQRVGQLLAEAIQDEKG